MKIESWCLSWTFHERHQLFMLCRKVSEPKSFVSEKLGVREQHYVGGIVRFANGKWYANNADTYTCNPMNTDGWSLLEDLLVFERA